MGELKWLPPKADLNNYNTVIDLIKYLYSIFEKDFKNTKNHIIFNGQNVKYSYLPLHTRCSILTEKEQTCNNSEFNCKNCPYIDKEDIFNHITCSELSKDIRTPGIFELERAIRVSWIRPIIENCNIDHPSIKYYESIVDGQLRKCFWLNVEKYLVILTEDNNKDLFLTSAYYLYNRKKSDRARRDYKKYLREIEKERQAKT